MEKKKGGEKTTALIPASRHRPGRKKKKERKEKGRAEQKPCIPLQQRKGGERIGWPRSRASPEEKKGERGGE